MDDYENESFEKVKSPQVLTKDTNNASKKLMVENRNTSKHELNSDTHGTRIISKNSLGIKKQEHQNIEVFDSEDEHPLEESSEEKSETKFDKVKELDDNRAFGFTKEALEHFKAPVDDEVISESEDKDKSEEDYEDDEFD